MSFDRDDSYDPEIQLLQSHLTHRAIICYAMVVAGMVCLAAGVAMLVVGLKGDQVIWFQSGNFKVTAGGFGAVTMLASVAWGYVAYRSRPEIHYTSPQVEMTLAGPITTPRKFTAKTKQQREQFRQAYEAGKRAYEEESKGTASSEPL